MCTINFYGSIDITIEGQSYGLTCDWSYSVGCGSPNGTYTVYFLDGSINVCPPGSEESCGLNQNYPSVQYTQVFCDPCLNKCTKDGNTQVYNGNQKWMFTTYVNNAPSPRPIVLDTFTVNGNDKKLSAGGEGCCCYDDTTFDIFLEQKQIPIQSLIQASQQPYIESGDDPSTACDCGCPTGFCGPVINGCGSINDIFSMWRDMESNNCTTFGGDNTYF